MKRSGFSSLYLFPVILLACLLGACSDDNDKTGSGESLLGVNLPSISTNKKGPGDDDNALKIVITSNTFREGPDLEPMNQILVNIWDCDPACQVAYSEDGGQSWKSMAQITEGAYDPTAYCYFGKKGDGLIPSCSPIGAR